MRNLVEWMEALEIPNCKVFPCLEKLSVEWCSQLKTAPSHFSALRELDIISVDSMAVANIYRNLTNITSIRIAYISNLTFLTEGLLKKNKNLTSLRIEHCPELMYIAPDVSGYCTSLRLLYIENCRKLSYLLDGLHTLVSLEELRINWCPNLECIPSILGLTSLRELAIWSCEKLSYLPSGLQSCTSLATLWICDCPNRISLPEDLLRELRSLSRLRRIFCKDDSPLTIPPNATLNLTQKESWDMNIEEKIEAAVRKTEGRTVLFKASEYAKASKRYQKQKWIGGII
ncbi:hypothetical protein L1049_015729 [Liquidambar formosana]|uniref:Uncharacterized protein n=1 Tax=Liquidambar formosana TaxID=63359 RepID=A0AAP0S5C2_LIQFO